MKIHLQQIPIGGAHVAGEEECPIGEVPQEDILCAGPLRYALDVGISEGSLWANGRLEQPVSLRCVGCLERFPHTIFVPQFTAVVELHGPETVDLTPLAREDILLNLPAYPRCDKHGGRTCKAAKISRDTAAEAARARIKREADWSALDKLNL